MVVSNTVDDSKLTKYISCKQIKKKYVLIDAEGWYVGRLASRIVTILRGKNKTFYTPFLDCGDNVIVVNCDKLLFSGKKTEKKSYLRHTGYPGGQRWTYVKDLIVSNPTKILMQSVKGMLPKNRLGRKLLTNLRCFVGSNHDFGSFNPEKIILK